MLLGRKTPLSRAALSVGTAYGSTAYGTGDDLAGSAEETEVSPGLLRRIRRFLESSNQHFHQLSNAHFRNMTYQANGYRGKHHIALKITFYLDKRFTP